MPGSLIIKPIEANLTHDVNFITRMNPYCAFNIGNNVIKGQVCNKGGKHPHWNDSVALPIKNEDKILIELKDKDKISPDDDIASFMLDLKELQASGHVSKWYPVYYKDKAAGEIYLEAEYRPSGITSQSQYYEQGQQAYAGEAGTIAQGEVDVSKHSNVWTEQKQVVEPRTFMKEVEVVETRPVSKEIEVMEPVKVMKDVQCTEAVPVKKQVETVEPQVVKKEVEVMEPQLVTKTIQVVENVPVKKQVEVVEMKNVVKEVETLEPRTFTKQVEVTEFQPMKKQVEVTQPVTLKKAVEFVEPVITTQTITKELKQPVVVDEKVTTTVGPASVVGMSAEYGYAQSYGEISLAEQERLSVLKRWVGYETIFSGLTDQEKLWEQQRLSRLNEEEWLREREKLLGLSKKDRLTQQRGFFAKLKEGLGLGKKSSQPYSTEQHDTRLKHQHRWHGLENLFSGLNEEERMFEQERINRLSDKEWSTERERLLNFKDQDRLIEQRKLYNEYYNLSHSSKYNPSPNF